MVTCRTCSSICNELVVLIVYIRPVLFCPAAPASEPAIAPVDVAYRAISTALLGEISMLTGQTIKWDPEKEEIIGNPMASRLLSRPYRKPWELPTV